MGPAGPGAGMRCAAMRGRPGGAQGPKGQLRPCDELDAQGLVGPGWGAWLRMFDDG